MKIFNLFFAFIFLCGCQTSDIELFAYDSKLECHMCPGYLVVNKNNLTDTIMTGSSGKVQGLYSVTEIDNKDFVVIKSSYFSGGWIEKIINIYSTEDDSFLDLVFSKSFLEQEETYEKVDELALKLNRINRSFQFTFDANVLIVDIDSTLSYLIEPSMDLIQISSGSAQKRFVIE